MFRVFAHFFEHFFSALSIHILSKHTFEPHHSLAARIVIFNLICIAACIPRAQTESTISTNSPVSLISVKIKRANRQRELSSLRISVLILYLHALRRAPSHKTHILRALERKKMMQQNESPISTLRLDVLVTTNIMVIKADK